MTRVAPTGMEYWTDDIGQSVMVHSEDRCSGKCAIHNPSDHYMSSYPRVWDDNQKMMTRLCPHGLFHPDPQQIQFFEMLYGPERAKKVTRHTPDDSCCQDFIDGEVIVGEIENPRKEIES
jgi:hypothetical protein